MYPPAPGFASRSVFTRRFARRPEFFPGQLLVFVLLVLRAGAQTPACPCHYWVQESGVYQASQVAVQPGQTVCIQAGQYTQLRFVGFVGSAEAPIRFINYGGQVVVNGDAYNSGIQFYRCRFFKITGSGDDRYTYGFRVYNPGRASGSALNVTAKSSDCEIERTELSNAGFAGMMVKTDPDCDTMTWRQNFTMRNVKIHDNYIHDVGGEGLYIGNSFWSGGRPLTCAGVARRAFPHEIHGLEVYRNRVERSAAEAIQYGCAPGAKVHHNEMTDTGTSPFANFQNNGLQMGEGSSGECYNNVLRNIAGSGLVLLSNNGDVRVYNNLVVGVGVDGLFSDNRAGSPVGTAVGIYNNTFLNVKRDGIRMYNEINVNTVANNLVGSVGARFISFQQGARANQLRNVFTNRPDTLRLTNLPEGDYRPTPTSPLVDVGSDVSAWNLTFDLLDAPRPTGRAYDVGAYELSTAGPKPVTFTGGFTGRELATCTSLVTLVPEIPGKPVLTALPAPTDETVVVFPTPCLDRLTLRVPPGSTAVTLLDPAGRVVGQRTGGEVTAEVTLPTGHLPGGLYLYRVETPRGVLTGKWLRQ